MGDKTSISWTATTQADGTVTEGATWNPLLGCTKVSAGCQKCYAVTVAAGMMRKGNDKVQADYAGLTMVHRNGMVDWSGVVRFLPDRLAIPMKWARPRRIFVNSMSDMFHPDVREEDLDAMFCVMAMCPQHTFQILTKRPERMLEYIITRDALGVGRDEMVAAHAGPLAGIVWDGRGSDPNHYLTVAGTPPTGAALKKRRIWPGWPLPNVWLGTSVEHQEAANERIPYLLRTPAAVRFLSCEPLLDRVDLCLTTPISRVLGTVPSDGGYPELGQYNTLTGEWWPALGNAEDEGRLAIKGLPRLHWVIAGGESGSGFRHMNRDWALYLRMQCKHAEVPFFFKQDSGIRSGMGEDALGEVIHQFPGEGVPA